MLAGGTIGGITAYSNGQDVLSGVVTGAIIGGAVGAVVGLGSGAILAGLKSGGTKFVSDLTAYITFGKEFGKWEDYAIAFSFGGLTKGLKFGNTEKFIADVFVRPAAVQLSKMGTRGKSFSIEKYSYDVISRSITFGMPTDLKPIARGLFSGYYDSLKSNNQYLLSYDNFI